MICYVIVTPAYNEEACIEKTIESVLVQPIRPLLWVIVDDGSTDKTPDIINNYVAEHSWIRYVRRVKDPSQSYYSSNVYAIYEGIKHVRDLKNDFLAILDADISLPSGYYQQILSRMQADEKLGIASGVYQDNVNGTMRKMLNDRRSTPKAIMVFRKTCFEEIGGFIPMKHGGEDTVACFMARMNGWKSWSFPDIVATHNKPVGTGHAKKLYQIRFRQGIGEYYLGTHWFFMLVKSVRRCFIDIPFMLGGLARLTGYIYAYFMNEKRQLSDELIQFIRKEQIARIFYRNAIPKGHKVKLI
jgi:biofilm PGA synthesis N-glycosyltransferase PgaC